jgi:signal transduction histidine kinase
LSPDLANERGAIVLWVRDFGVGFDARTVHFRIGLSSMPKRLRIFGGEPIAEFIPGNGTKTIARVKLANPQANATKSD